jgi:hypothetical protein
MYRSGLVEKCGTLPSAALVLASNDLGGEKSGHHIRRPMTVVSAFTNSRTVDPHDIGRGDGSLPKAGILSRCGRSCSRKVGRQRAEPATKEFIQRCRGIRSLFLGSGIRSDNGKLMSFSGGLVHNSRGQSKQVSMPREFQLPWPKTGLTL